MNFQQQAKCKELLDMVSKEDLISMAKTIRKQEYTTAEEAVEVILRYTKTPMELLKRQKLKKDTLETYLINKMKKSSRDSLIEITLKLWNEDTNFDDAGALKSSKCVPPPAIASGSGTNGTKRKGDPSPTLDDGKKQLRIELDKQQKSDCEELLNLMQDDELFALGHSATKQTFEDRKEAVKTILEYTTTPKKLLEMPKMTKDTLKYYLRNKKVDFDGSAGKKYLVDQVMQVWNQDTSSDAKTTKNSAEASNPKAKATKSAAEAPNPKVLSRYAVKKVRAELQEEGEIVSISPINLYRACSNPQCNRTKLVNNKCRNCGAQYDAKTGIKSAYCKATITQDKNREIITLFTPQIENLMKNKDFSLDEPEDVVQDNIQQELPVKVAFTRTPQKNTLKDIERI